MAAVRMDKTTTLGIKVEIGTTSSGGTAYATRNINVINPALSDANALALATALGDLQQNPVNAIVRTDKATLVNS